MAAPPLTHHDILALAEPFARRGRHVDLAASQRQERRLVFKPRADAAPDATSGAETLRLDCLGENWYRLTRTLERGDGLRGVVRAQGPDLAQLLADLDAVPAAQHFVAGPGFAIARSYTLDGLGGTAAMALTHGAVQVAGLVLTLAVPAAPRLSADIALEPTSNRKLVLPEDVLAVLGWNWARLVPARQGWTSKLRLRGEPRQRTRHAEAALERAATHLAQILAEPPARYHERVRVARWGVFLRRGIPTLTALSLFGAVALFARFRPDLPPAVLVALYHVPTLIVAVSFVLQELPRFEIPPWPRRLLTPVWYDEPPAAAWDPTRAGTSTA